MNFTRISIAVLLSLALSTAAFAHHQFASEFDWKKPVTLKGTITKVEWSTPHAVLHIDAKWSDNEMAMAKDALETIQEMADAAGFRVLYTNATPAPPGFCIHETGTARMGDDPKKSVLNKWNQVWDVKNVFVTDGASFASQGCQNPTLTMMAITARACDFIATEAKKGTL